MGWEFRKGNRYYYRVHKLNGRVVREYVFRGNSPLAAEAAILMADGERHLREAREAKRRASFELRVRVGDLLREVATANAELRVAVGAMLVAVGYHTHKGEWRMARKTLPGAVSGESPDLPPGIADAMIVHVAPNNNSGAADLFARVRAGDKAAQRELRRWMRETHDQIDHYGDLAMRATFTLVSKITGGDPVWRIAVEEKVKAMTTELLGDSPTMLDRLLVRRVINGWLAVHALELEMAVRPPRQMRDRAYLEAAIGKASKGFTTAVTELARVRRLNIPQVLVNFTPPPPPPPRMAEAEAIETTETAKPSRLPSKKAKRGKSVKGSGRKAA